MNRMKMVSQSLGIVSLLSIVGVAGPALATDNIDPDDTGAQFAWGENTGWLNAEPGGRWRADVYARGGCRPEQRRDREYPGCLASGKLHRARPQRHCAMPSGGYGL